MLPPKRFRVRLVPALLAGIGSLAGCGRKNQPEPSSPAARDSSPLTQSVYVWQRDWTDAVRGAVKEHGPAFSELAVLAAQMEWKSAGAPPSVVRPDVDWKTLAATGRPVNPVIRIEKAGTPEQTAETVLQEARRLTDAAAATGLRFSGMQIDYDSPQKKLAAYTAWLREISEGVKPLPVRITTLASWLAEPDFKALTGVCDGYVLQVHSFDRPAPGKRPAVFDPAKTRVWVKQAGILGRPFTLALPTYRTTAGYDAAGKLVGLATDSISPAWTPETKLEDFPADPDALSALVEELSRDHPAALRGIWWYRLPVSTDTRNWRWKTMAAVMAGRAPVSKLEVTHSSGQPMDFILLNNGEKDEWLPAAITVRWEEPAEVRGDGIAGWMFANGMKEATFTASSALRGRLLPTGQSMALGWVRFRGTPSPELRTEVSGYTMKR